jgi:hypothetical protein
MDDEHVLADCHLLDQVDLVVARHAAMELNFGLARPACLVAPCAIRPPLNKIAIGPSVRGRDSGMRK